LSSIHFIMKRAKNITNDQLFRVMRSKIVTIDRKNIEIALNILKGYELI